MSHPLPRRLAAESVGTALLLLAVVGSGIMAQRTCSNDGLALLANALATAGALFALITVFAPICGAHFNPAVSLLAAWRGELLRVAAVAYCIVQCAGALCGVMLAHALFEMPLLQSGGAARTGFLAIAVRRRRHFRITVGHRRLQRTCERTHSIGGGTLDHGCLLVHIQHLVRQPCGDFGPRLL